MDDQEQPDSWDFREEYLPEYPDWSSLIHTERPRLNGFYYATQCNQVLLHDAQKMRSQTSERQLVILP